MTSPIQEFAALNAPVAPDTWSFSATLARAVESTGVIAMPFTKPMEITGFHAVVVPHRPLAGGGLVIPTVDDIDVQIELNNGDRKFTAAFDETGPAGGLVPLAACTVLTPRLLRICPTNDSPDFQFQFAWRNFLSGTPFFEDAIVTLSLLGRYLTKDEVEARRAQ